MAEERGMDFTGNPLAGEYGFWRLMKFTFPSMLMMLFMGFYTFMDTVLVSRLINVEALSALNIACPVINILVGFGAMLASGGSAVVAAKMGAGQVHAARRNFTLIVFVGIAVGLLFAVVGVLFLDEIVWYLGANGVLYPYCRDYLLFVFIFAPVSLMQILFQTLFVTAGKPGLGMFLSVAAGLSNILFDYLFMEPLQMGIQGAALGTGMGALIPAVAGFLFFSSGKGILRFSKTTLDSGVVWKSCANGASEMVSQLAAAVTTFLFNITMLRFLGETGVAAVTIMIYMQFILTTLYIGFSLGAAPIISYRHGGGDWAALKKLLHRCLCFIGVLSLAIFILTMQFRANLIALFSPMGSFVYETAEQGFLVFPYAFLFCGINIFASAWFTALSDAKTSACIAVSRTFIFLVTALLLLPSIWQVAGVWLAVPLAEFLAFLLSVAFLLRCWRNLH